MRALLVFFLAFAFLPLVAPGTAQEAAAGPVQVLQDKAGDLTVTVTDSTQPLPESRFKSLDLVSASMAESAEEFVLSVQVAGLDQPPEVPGADDAIIEVNFRHNDQDYEAVFIRALGDQSYYFGYLLKYVPDGQGENFQRTLDITADPATGTISTVLLRDELLDREGAAPFPGRQFDAFVAVSTLRTHQEFGGVNDVRPFENYDVNDRMPDTGLGTTPFPIKLGLSQSGHAALWSADPIRASNGEQSTYVFNLTAQNSGSTEELFKVSATGAPSDWQVTIPDSYLRIGAGTSVHIPVLVSTPFSHTHGVLKKFRVEMQSQSDASSIGRLDLGIRYFTIPQPGGHHSSVYLHSSQFGSQNPLFKVFEVGFSGNSGFEYLNTLESDPADASVPIQGYFTGYYCTDGCPPGVPHTEWHWDIFLQPSLEMGLDFDLAGEGTLTVPIQTPIPLKDAVFGGHLTHLHYDEAQAAWVETNIANFTSTPVDLLPNAPQAYTFPVKANPAADFLPHAKRAYLALFLNLTSTRPSVFTGAEAPLMMPGGTMGLPLFEYRDPLQASFSTVGAVRLEATGEHERLVNPGKTALFTTRLTNDLDEEKTFNLTITGTHTEWARVVGEREVTVGPRSVVEVHTAVSVPAQATDRDAADLLLTAQAKDQSDAHGIVRLLALVDLGHEHPDEAAAVASLVPPPAKKGPAPQGPLFALGLLAMAALASRRGTGPGRPLK